MTVGKAMKILLLALSVLPIGQSWRRNWVRITPFFDFPPEICKVIYTTNAIKSVNMSQRNISKKWTMPIRDWKAALTRFTISYEGRLP